MTTDSRLLKFVSLFLAIFFLGACAAYRVTSTLNPSGNTQLALGQVRFSLARFSTVCDENDIGTQNSLKPLTRELLNDRAKALYPNLFTDNWTALPIIATAEVKAGGDGAIIAAAFASVFTACVIPIPFTMATDFSISTDVRDVNGDSLAAGKIPFQYKQTTWVTLIGPLGCIPVPGEADDRGSIFLFIPITGPSYAEAEKQYSVYLADRIIEAIAQQLRAINPSALNAAYRARASLLRDVVIDGQTVWSFLAPQLSDEDNRAVSFAALFYRDYPKRDAQPFETVEVARRDATGAWIPKTGYMRSTQSLTAVKVVMDKGVPAGIAVQDVTDPPLEDFVDLPDRYTANDIRWSNQILIEAKNTSLLRLMRYGSRTELTRLITQIEKNILSLNEKAQMADSQVQQIVVNGGDPKAANEMAVLHRQRITILEAILSALKRAGAR